MTDKTVHCIVYKSLRKANTYIFIPSGKKTEDLPESILQRLDPFEQVMELAVTPEKKLALTTGKQVLENFDKQGFHLQLPDDRDIDAIMASIASSTIKPGTGS